MKPEKAVKIFIFLALASAALRGGFVAAGEGLPANLAEEARGRDVAAEFMTRTIVPLNVQLVNSGKDAIRAKVMLLHQLKKRFPARKAPDLDLVRLCMKTEMRLNNGWLETAGGSKDYPAGKDFDNFAALGRKALKKYIGRMDKEHVWGPVDDKASQDILTRELKNGLRMLPTRLGKKVPDCAPLTPEDEELLKSGDTPL